jgi:hypothetical protein
MEAYNKINEWLLHDSDPSLMYQVKRDLLDIPTTDRQHD